MTSGLTQYRFSFGPWNIHSGEDPFGPSVRDEFSFAEKLGFFKKNGFNGIELHDDDVVPEIEKKNHSGVMRRAKEVKKMVDDEGLEAVMVAPGYGLTGEPLMGRLPLIILMGENMPWNALSKQ